MRLDRKRRLRVGDRVRFYLGVARVRAVVVEDRGNLCVDGGQLVRVEMRRSEIDGGNQQFEIPAKVCTK